jgi:thiamine kinase-like enzyme
MTGMSALWTTLADHAAPFFSSWADPDLAAIHRRLVSSVDRWWPALNIGPRTLIHNDFNPRNICLRGEHATLCAYDWELATLGAPQRDLAEFLCFVLPPDAALDDVSPWIERHRVALEREHGRPIDPDVWIAGFQGALYDLLINRLSVYAVVHRVRRQPFLPRIVRTWRNLYQLFSLDHVA